MPVKAERGTALLVDGDNLPPAMLEPLLAMLEREGPVPERKVFRNWRSSRDATSWDEACRRFGFERMDRYRAASDKNASDIAVVVSAMDLLHAGYRSFCIASGDTDFAPLVERLRRGGCHIVLVGHKADGGILEELADRYMPWTALTNGGRPPRKALPSRTSESPRPKGAAPPPKQRSNPSRAAKQAKAAPPAQRPASSPRSSRSMAAAAAPSARPTAPSSASPSRRC
ncbi:MAG TPA: NYN domain-containing protein, partial [Candidatus Thermoplasmatota archaeon]|nr:NYN domain-containing protein [Candidatus Thermoplasmatota archaeon]